MDSIEAINLVPVPIEEAFPDETGRRLAVIGAGGKSTTIGRIADVQAYRNPPVAVTTTTKIQREQVAGPLHEEISEELTDNPPAMFTLARPVESGHPKLEGLDLENLESWLDQFPGRVLIEADGARSAKLKVHREFEPVIPEHVDAVLSLFDLSVVDQPANEDTVHALEAWGEMFPGEQTVTPDLIAELFERDHGYQLEQGTEHWLAMTHPGGLRRELVDLIDRFPTSFWTRFERVIILQNRNIFQLHIDGA